MLNSIQTSFDIATTQNIKPLLNDFINYLDVKKESLATYRKALKQFFLYLECKCISKPKREDIIEYKRFLIDSGKKASTQQIYLVAVRVFFQWLEEKGIYKNIASKVKCAKVSCVHKKDYLTPQQIQSFLKTFKRDTVAEKRDFAIAMLLTHNGLRTIEISRLNIEDIRQYNGSICIYIQRKGKDDKTPLLLSDSTFKAIQEYRQVKTLAPVNTPLFTSLSNNCRHARLSTKTIRTMIKSHLKEIGLDLPTITTHSLRHSAGFNCYKNNVSMIDIQNLLGHVNINTTNIYINHSALEENQCFDTLEQLYKIN